MTSRPQKNQAPSSSNEKKTKTTTRIGRPRVPRNDHLKPNVLYALDHGNQIGFFLSSARSPEDIRLTTSVGGPNGGRCPNTERDNKVDAGGSTGTVLPVDSALNQGEPVNYVPGAASMSDGIPPVISHGQPLAEYHHSTCAELSCQNLAMLDLMNETRAGHQIQEAVSFLHSDTETEPAPDSIAPSQGSATDSKEPKVPEPTSLNDD